ncbi:LysR family transcriptional regulator [Nonomuraea typhae]|uniref:LysR family transcriptional regulator n=1 Tax=Nonomuraea typhae TaxID=2603600 RepID=UPI0012F7E198|nr:LysR family transcriptional regulator [Nonomuraea typhae]
MEIRQLEYFLAIVDHGGFNRAAAALYLAQPSLSQAIQGLERDLGGRLFHRIGRRAVLTEAGQALIEPARAVVRDMELARSSVGAVRELRSGRLDISAMPSQAVEPLSTMMERFAVRHPGVTVSVKAAFTPREVVEQVRSGASELGLVASMRPLPEKEVRVQPVGEQRFVLVTPPDGPFPAGRPVPCERLAGHRVIAGQRGTGMRQYVDELRASGIGLIIAAETEHRVGILPLVLKGVGLAVLTESWKDLAERVGALVLELSPATSLSIALVSRRAELTPAAAAFLALASEDRQRL